MRDLDAGLAAALAGGVTTHARCFVVRRRDGAVFGFTDHDRDLDLDGVACRAGTGVTASEASATLGLAPGGAEVAGALAAAALTEADLAAGLWDGARIETWAVDWRAPGKRALLDVAMLGEVRRADTAFVAELRALTAVLDEPRGRVYSARCDADLGDARCGVDLAGPGFRVAGTVETTDGSARLVAAVLAGWPDGFFSGGRLSFTSGANAGLVAEARLHRGLGAAGEVFLWAPAPSPIAAGDAFTLTAGCDRSFATCRAKFANALNFRGFPHLPGNDRLARGVRPSEALDGGSLFR
jgi:uncharacterized phage protein (TIGR02218 family)